MLVRQVCISHHATGGQAFISFAFTGDPKVALRCTTAEDAPLDNTQLQRLEARLTEAVKGVARAPEALVVRCTEIRYGLRAGKLLANRRDQSHHEGKLCTQTVAARLFRLILSYGRLAVRAGSPFTCVFGHMHATNALASAQMLLLMCLACLLVCTRVVADTSALRMTVVAGCSGSYHLARAQHPRPRPQPMAPYGPAAALCPQVAPTSGASTPLQHRAPRTPLVASAPSSCRLLFPRPWRHRPWEASEARQWRLVEGCRSPPTRPRARFPSACRQLATLNRAWSRTAS